MTKQNTSGFFELSDKEIAPKKSKVKLSWDLADVFPEIFIGKNPKIPKALNKLWRKALDKAIEDNKDGPAHYHHNPDDGAIITVIFEKHDKLSAKRLLNTAADNAKRLFKAQESGDPAKGEQSKEDQRVGQSDQALSNVIKQGLTGASSVKEFNFWASRATQEMHMLEQGSPLPATLIKQAKLFTVGFFPFWKAGAHALIGSFTTIVSSKGLTGNARTLQADIATLTSACLDARRMADKKIPALIIVPVSFNSFKQKNFYDLYVNILRKSNPDIYKYIVLEFRDTPTTLTESVKSQVMELKNFCRSFIINLNILSPPRAINFDSNIPHAYGVDLRSVLKSLSKDNVGKRLSKFSDFYKTQKTITFAKGITDENLAHKCQALDFTYISGPVVTKPQRQTLGIKKIALESLLANKNI